MKQKTQSQQLDDNPEGYSEEEIKQQQKIALIEMAAIKKLITI